MFENCNLKCFSVYVFVCGEREKERGKERERDAYTKAASLERENIFSKESLCAEHRDQ